MCYAAPVQTRTRNAFGLFAAAVAMAAGLGALAHTRRPIDVALGARALDAVPSGALLVATADLDALRASPVGGPFLREGREIKGVGKVKELCGFDPLDRMKEVAVAIPASGDTGDFGLVATGDLDADALVACASKVIEARGGRPAVTQIGGFRKVRDATLTVAGGEIAVRKGGPLILAAGEYLHEMIEAAEGRTPTIRSSAEHATLEKLVGDVPVRATLVLTAEQRRIVADELESGGAASDPTGAIRAGAFGMSLGVRVGLHAVLSCETAPACAAVARRLDDARIARSKDLVLRLVGFGAVLDRMVVRAEGGTVHARVELGSDEAAQLIDRVLALRGARRPTPTDDGEKRDPPQPESAPSTTVAVDAGAPKDAGASASPRR